TAVPRCSTTTKATNVALFGSPVFHSFQLNSAGMRTLCPRLETGNNSNAPCKSAITIACNQLILITTPSSWPVPSSLKAGRAYHSTDPRHEGQSPRETRTVHRCYNARRCKRVYWGAAMVTDSIGTVAFIGAGAMAEAMLAGMLARGVVRPEQVAASHPRPARRDDLHARYGICVVEHNCEAAQGADLVVLTVKPQVIRGVLAEIRETVAPEQVILSIAAGVPLSTIVGGLGGHGAAARAMPNPPAQIGEGVSVWTTTASVTAAQQ